MIENGYEQKLNINYSEIDCNFSLKPFALLNFLQNIACDNAEYCNIGFPQITPKNMAWFLIKYHIEFSKYAVGKQDLILKTKARGFNKLFFYRDFELWQQNKNILRATSLWTIIDTVSHSMLKPETAFPDNPVVVPYKKQEDDLDFVKIKIPDNFDKEEVFQVRYNDLDINGHANNGNYIIWAFEPLDFDFKTNYGIKTLDIIYKKEAKFKEKITSRLKIENNITTHVITNSANEDLCYIQCIWYKLK